MPLIGGDSTIGNFVIPNDTLFGLALVLGFLGGFVWYYFIRADD